MPAKAYVSTTLIVKGVPSAGGVHQQAPLTEVEIAEASPQAA
ncbi:hypothetical protein ACFL51_00455 [Myxococcota bacterium]